MPLVHTTHQSRAPEGSAPYVDTAPSWADVKLSNRHQIFCAQEWYQGVLQHHIRKLTITPTDYYLDVGSGTGCGTELISDRLRPGGLIVGIEPSEGLVRCATKKAEGDGRIKYKVGRAEDISAMSDDRKVNGIVSFNTVHLLSSREQFYRAAQELLTKDGTLSFCTGYHTRGMSEVDRGNVLNALFEAFTIGKERVRAWKEISPQRKVNELFRPQYLELANIELELRRSGFSTVNSELQLVTVPASSFAEFLTLPGWELLPKLLPLEQQREIILTSLERHGIEEVSRTWLHVYAE
jgi:SAM-dependent methyltransferase